jgi:hypothetical protein
MLGPVSDGVCEYLDSFLQIVIIQEFEISLVSEKSRITFLYPQNTHITYIGLSPASKRAPFRALRMLISNCPLFAFGAAAEERSGDRRRCR